MGNPRELYKTLPFILPLRESWLRCYPGRSIKINSQKPKKVLDKSSKMCYNKSTKGEGKATTKGGCPRERVRPLPHDPTARCVGLRNTNVNQSQFAEEMLDYAYYKAIPFGGRNSPKKNKKTS
jgi:hypothetical protein